MSIFQVWSPPDKNHFNKLCFMEQENKVTYLVLLLATVVRHVHTLQRKAHSLWVAH